MFANYLAQTNLIEDARFTIGIIYHVFSMYFVFGSVLLIELLNANLEL